jgi:hypothetical protein
VTSRPARPITTAGDHSGMLQTGQGARNADSALEVWRGVALIYGAHIGYPRREANPAWKGLTGHADQPLRKFEPTVLQYAPA